MKWEVVEYDGPQGLAQLERDWLRIYSSMPLRSVYHSLHAHRLYARHLKSPDHQLRYFGLHDGACVRAICPLEAAVDRGLGVPMKVLATPFHRHWPLSDIICPEDDARPAFIPALADHLRRIGERRLLMLGPVPVKSMLWNGLRSLDHRTYCAYEADVFDVFDCSIPFESLFDRLPRKRRQDIRRRHRQLDELPQLRRTRTVSEPELSREFEWFLNLEACDWKVAGGNAIKPDPALTAFYRGLLSLRDAGDHVILMGIFTEERCIASEFTVRTGRQITGMKTGYDDEYARLAPGMQLFRDCLEYCCTDPGITLLNTIGTPQWVQPWLPQSVPLGRVSVALTGGAGRARIAAAALRYGPARPLLHRVREGIRQAKSTRQAETCKRTAPAPAQTQERSSRSPHTS